MGGIGTIGLSALGLLPFRQTVAPRRRGTSLLGFEDAVELGARRETTLGRDGVVAIVRIFAHHILRHLKTYSAKPYAEGAVLTLVKILGEVPLGDAHAAREGQQVGCAVLVAHVGTPVVEPLLDKGASLGREHSMPVVGNGLARHGLLHSHRRGLLHSHGDSLRLSVFLLLAVQEFVGGHIAIAERDEVDDKEQEGQQPQRAYIYNKVVERMAAGMASADTQTMKTLARE